jgi:hypothetical protein
MDKEELVINAVKLAKDQGVRFDEKSPTFRKSKGKEVNNWFSVIINAYPVTNTQRAIIIEKRFDFLDQFDEKSLAMFFIKVFNENEAEQKAKPIL